MVGGRTRLWNAKVSVHCEFILRPRVESYSPRQLTPRETRGQALRCAVAHTPLPSSKPLHPVLCCPSIHRLTNSHS